MDRADLPGYLGALDIAESTAQHRGSQPGIGGVQAAAALNHRKPGHRRESGKARQPEEQGGPVPGPDHGDHRCRGGYQADHHSTVVGGHLADRYGEEQRIADSGAESADQQSRDLATARPPPLADDREGHRS
jgi:hypothetical protein